MSETETIQLAKDAYIYGYPMVDGYNVLHRQALDKESPEFKARLNSIGHARTTARPEDKSVIAPNVDTPYSYAWLDLRAEPVVVTIPPFETNRYVSLQLIDLYTYIVGYVSPRTFGNSGGQFFIAGPAWNGNAPAGIKHVFRSPTSLLLAFYRTQLFDERDLKKVHALQDRFKITPLSKFLKAASPAPQVLPTLVQPINLRTQPTALEFFTVLNWMLQFMPVLPEETALRARFERIGIRPGEAFQPDEKTAAAVVKGMQQGLAEMGQKARQVRSSAEIFGSREFLKDNYMARALGAMLGIYGNAAEEYLGVGYQADAEGKPFNGEEDYRIKFAADGLPPVGAFWSITVYNSARLLEANPRKRYVINSPMLPQLQKDADGGFTLYLQHTSPGVDKEANWLPAPRGPFVLTFRTYQPGEAIRTGKWTAPPVVQVK